MYENAPKETHCSVQLVNTNKKKIKQSQQNVKDQLWYN